MELTKKTAGIIALCVVLAVTVTYAVMYQPASDDNTPPLGLDPTFPGESTPQPTAPPTYNQNPSTPSQLTSLTIILASPNPMTMGGTLAGTVVGGGQNIAGMPITLYGKNLGSGEVISFDATLNPSGKYEHIQNLNTPGYWEFWATSGAVESPHISLTCRGILIVGSTDHYSHTFGDPITFKCYTHYSNTNVALYANDPSSSTAKYMTNLAINNKGYCAVSFEPSDSTVWHTGSYEADTMIGTETGHDYGGSFWFTVGR